MKIKTIRLLTIVLITLLLQPRSGNAQATDSVGIDLNKAIEMALSENPTIKIANRDIEVKKNYRKEQIVPFFPDVSGNASYNRTLQKQKMVMEMGGQSMEIGVGSWNNWSLGVTGSLPIVAPAMWYNLQLTKLDIELAMENARSSRVSLINEVKKAYYSYLLVKESYAVLQLTYNNLVDNYENISEKYEQGMISEFDKLRAEVQMKNQIPSVKSTEKQLELATMMLKVLIGVKLDEPLIFGGALQNYEEEMEAKVLPDIRNLSLNNNADVHQLDIAIRQLETGLKIIKSSSAPTLGLNIAWSYSAMDDAFKFKDYRWFPYSYVAVGLNIPIVSWAGTTYQIKSAKLNMANLQDQRNYLLDNLQVSVSNSISQISNAVEELNSNKETLLQAEKAYSIAKKQYDIGMGTWLDLNSAELALTSSRLLYYQSIYNYLSAYADLEKTLGE